MPCPRCQSEHVIKRGKTAYTGKQRFYCKECGYTFTLGEDARTSKNRLVKLKIKRYVPNCRYCYSDIIIKSGKTNGKQRYKCKRCGRTFL